LNQDDRIKRIEEFIRKMDDHEIEFTVNAGVKYAIDEQNALGQTKQKVTGTLSDHLSRALEMYESAKNLPDNAGYGITKEFKIGDAILWINRAETTSAVKPSDKIYSEYKKALETIKKQEQDNAELYAELRNKETENAKNLGRIQELEILLQKATWKDAPQ